MHTTIKIYAMIIRCIKVEEFFFWKADLHKGEFKLPARSSGYDMPARNIRCNLRAGRRRVACSYCFLKALTLYILRNTLYIF